METMTKPGHNKKQLFHEKKNINKLNEITQINLLLHFFSKIFKKWTVRFSTLQNQVCYTLAVNISGEKAHPEK